MDGHSELWHWRGPTLKDLNQRNSADDSITQRGSSSSNPLNTYNQVAQRSGDRRCSGSNLALASTGDGLGWWSCTASGTGPATSPRLARLTAPGS